MALRHPIVSNVTDSFPQDLRMSKTNRQILIADMTHGKLTAEHFKLIESPLPVPGEQQVLLRIRYLVIDAAMRAWMLGPTYRAALKAGEVMAGAALAVVVESRTPGFAVGDLVFTDDAGCQEYVALGTEKLRKLER